MVWIQIYWKLHLVWVSYKFSFYIPQFLPQYSELSLEITSSLPLLNFSIYIKDLKHQQLSLSQGDNIQLLLTHRAVTPLACPTCSAARDQQSCRDKPLIRCHPISIRRISAQCWHVQCAVMCLHFVFASTLRRDTFASSRWWIRAANITPRNPRKELQPYCMKNILVAKWNSYT